MAYKGYGFGAAARRAPLEERVEVRRVSTGGAPAPSSGGGTRPSRDTGRAKGAGTRHVAGLDGWRALAIIAVVCYHLDLPCLPSGHIGVVMFLVLTGYLATSSLLRRIREGLASIGRFWVRRIMRIWPSMAIMVACAVLGCIAFNHVLLTKARPDVLPALGMFENISYILRGVSYFDQIGGPSPLTHLWYLGIDAQFCFVWPLAMLAFDLLPSRAGARRIILVLACISALMMGVLYNPNEGITRVYYGPDTRAFAPLLGAWLAYACPLGRRPARSLRPLLRDWRLPIEIAGLLALVILGLGMALVPDTSILLYRGGFFLTSILCAIVLLAIVLPGGIISLILSLPPLVWLGTRSFGVYLWHYPLIQLFGATYGTGAWWRQALVVALSLLLAELSYRFVEQPLGRLVQGGSSDGSTHTSMASLPSPVTLAALVALLIVLVTDGIGLAFVPDETLVPEEALVSTGDAADKAMDLRGTKTDSEDGGGTGKDDSSKAGNGFHLKGKSTTDSTQNAGDTSSDAESGVTQDGDWTDGISVYDIALHASEQDVSDGVRNPVIIADSVPGDAYDYWAAQCPDGLMDSYIGRRPDQALTVLDQYLEQDVVGKVVILQAFSNVACTAEELDHMIEACGSGRHVYLVNVRIPESEEAQINQTLAEAAARHENAELIDWYGYSEGHDDWIYPDGEHLTPEGQPYYISMLVEAIGADFVSSGGSVTRVGMGRAGSGGGTGSGITSSGEAAADGADTDTDSGTTTEAATGAEGAGV